MSVETAKRCVEVAFETPSPAIKIEFQGGEPSLNFAAVLEAVLYTEHLNTQAKKALEFVICTKWDGPQSLHDSCRLSGSGQPTYATVVDADF